MRVSVNLGSSRPGGIDISFYGLSRQTYQDFEIIFVDSLYHQRHSAVIDAWASTGSKIPLYHVPNHRYNGTDIWPQICAGFNTGFMLSDGELVLMMMDHAYANPRWIEEHVAHHVGRRRLLMAPVSYRGPLPVRTKTGVVPHLFYQSDFNTQNIEQWHAQFQLFDLVSILAEPFSPDQIESLLHIGGRSASPGVCLEDNMCTKNESFPLEAVLEANGMDEYYDCTQQGPGDHDLAHRLRNLGLELWSCSEAPLLCSHPRQVLPNAGSLFTMPSGRLPPPWDYKLSRDEASARYMNMRSSSYTVARNPINLREMRSKVWDWRELSQLRDAVIPRITIPDQEYFK